VYIVFSVSAIPDTWWDRVRFVNGGQNSSTLVLNLIEELTPPKCRGSYPSTLSAVHAKSKYKNSRIVVLVQQQIDDKREGHAVIYCNVNNKLSFSRARFSVQTRTQRALFAFISSLLWLLEVYSEQKDCFSWITFPRDIDHCLNNVLPLVPKYNIWEYILHIHTYI